MLAKKRRKITGTTLLKVHKGQTDAGFIKKLETFCDKNIDAWICEKLVTMLLTFRL